MFPLLNGGFSSTCFDGKPFFSSEHPAGKDGKSKVSNMDVPAKPEEAKTPWFVLDCSSSLKPLIYQLREAPTFVQMQYELEKSNRLIYGFKARFNVGFGFWQRAYASKQALTAENLMKVLTAMKSLKNNEGIPHSRHKIALTILEKLLLLIKEGDWGIANTFKTERASIDARNYYGPELFEQDIAMWGISWQQKCLLGKDIFDDEGSLPNQAMATTKTNNEIKVITKR